jgi:hypothetical protein
VSRQEADQENLVKRIDFYYFLSWGLILLAIFGVPKHTKHRLVLQPIAAMSKQQLASHSLLLKDEDGETLGMCTGTAIGPHALLTAEHCLERGGVKKISPDLATEDHNILAVAGDGRDHVLLLLDGSPFTNYITVKPGTAKLKDLVNMYGAGGGEYPPAHKSGHVVDCQDPSDVDTNAGIVCTTLPIIPGDSGSAVYEADGEMVGIVTYSDTERPYTNVDFALNFSQKMYNDAAAFDGTHTPKPVTKKKVENPFDIF